MYISKHGQVKNKTICIALALLEEFLGKMAEEILLSVTFEKVTLNKTLNSKGFRGKMAHVVFKKRYKVKDNLR